LNTSKQQKALFLGTGGKGPKIIIHREETAQPKAVGLCRLPGGQMSRGPPKGKMRPTLNGHKPGRR